MPNRKLTDPDAAHDILAAEEFGVPAPDPELHHGPVVLPEDPSGIAEPHDILAAEEFAMPAARRPHGTVAEPPRASGALVGMAGALAGGFMLARLLRRR